MEGDSSLFSLSIDPATRTHLSEAAKWARILAISGMVLLLIVFGTNLYHFLFGNNYRGSSWLTNSNSAAENAGGVFGMLLVLLVPFFALIFILRFANLMKKAVAADDQSLLNASFQNLKIYLRYLAIITLIFVVLLALSFIFKLINLAS